MKINNIKDITDFIFLGKDIEELKKKWMNTTNV